MWIKDISVDKACDGLPSHNILLHQILFSKIIVILKVRNEISWLGLRLCSALTFSLLRLAELLPFVDVNRHWGIVSKCLTYSKAASDPFAYSLLRQQYKKVLVTVVNKLLRRDLYPSSGHNSSVDTENDYCLQRIS